MQEMNLYVGQSDDAAPPWPTYLTSRMLNLQYLNQMECCLCWQNPRELAKVTPADLKIPTEYEGLATELIVDGKIVKPNLKSAQSEPGMASGRAG